MTRTATAAPTEAAPTEQGGHIIPALPQQEEELTGDPQHEDKLVEEALKVV